MSSKRLIQQQFNRSAQRYNDAAFLQREIAERLFERLNLLRTPPRAALDLGTGTGYALELFKRHYPDSFVLGLDFALQMCYRAQSHDLPIVCTDIHRLPIAEASVDWVIGNCVLQWTDPDVLFQEVKRVLKPGGILFLSTFGPDTLKECKASWSMVDEAPHIHDFADMHDLGDMLLRYGFEDPVADREDLQVTYSDPLLLLKDLKALGAQNALPTRRKTFTGKHRFSQYAKAYEQFKLDNNLYPASYEVIYLHANKRKSSGSESDPIRLSPYPK